MRENLSARNMEYSFFVERVRRSKSNGMEITCKTLACLFDCVIGVLHPAYLWTSSLVTKWDDIDILIGLQPDHSVYSTGS